MLANQLIRFNIMNRFSESNLSHIIHFQHNCRIFMVNKVAHNMASTFVFKNPLLISDQKSHISDIYKSLTQTRRDKRSSFPSGNHLDPFGTCRVSPLVHSPSILSFRTSVCCGKSSFLYFHTAIIP